MVWWIAWFVALPFGVEDEARGQGTIDSKADKNIANSIAKNRALSSAAPQKTFLYRKFVIVTFAATIITTLLQLAIYKL